MLELKAKTRTKTGKKVKSLRQAGILPAVLYGPKTKSLTLEVDLKQFDKILQAVGESSLLSLKIKDEKEAKSKEKEYLVLVHQVEHDPLTFTPVHVDFYQPDLEKEVTVTMPIVLEGEAPAVKELGGTLIRNIAEVEVRAKPQLLPKDIRVSVATLISFGDHILIKDLNLPTGVKVLKEPEEIVAIAEEPEKVEEELAKPIEEKVEEVEKAEGKEAVSAMPIEGEEETAEENEK